MSYEEFFESFGISQLNIQGDPISVPDLTILAGNVVFVIIIVLLSRTLNSNISQKYTSLMCMMMGIGLLVQLYDVVFDALTSCASYMMLCVSTIFGIVTYAQGLGLDMSGLSLAGSVGIPIICSTYTNMGINIFKASCCLGLCGTISGSGRFKSLSGITSGSCKFLMWFFGIVTSFLVVYISTTCKVVGSYSMMTLRTAKLSAGTLSPMLGKDLGEISEVVFDSLAVISATAGKYITSSIVALCVFPLIRAELIFIELKLLGSITENISDSKCLTNAATGGMVAISILFSVCICLLLVTSALCGVCEKFQI